MTTSSLLASKLVTNDSDSEKLVVFFQLVTKWRLIHNLSGAKSTKQFASQAEDCLPLLRAITDEEHSVADLGSGNGLPGLLIALLKPQLNVTLIESRFSKSSFLTQTAIELGLNNVTVVADRIEKWTPANNKFPDLICARAVAPLVQLANCANHFVHKGAKLLVLKSKDPKVECAELVKTFPRWQIISCEKTGGSPSRFLVKAQAN